MAHRAEPSAGRLLSLAAAVIAVLAALGTLFSHHRSITALAVKNEAILTQARAIAALAGGRVFLPVGCALSGVGLVLLVLGFSQAR